MSGDDLVEPTPEQMEEQARRKQAFRDAQATDGRSGEWYDPTKHSPSQMLRTEFFELIEELVPEALKELSDAVLPTYRELFDARVLSMGRGSLSVRGCGRATMRQLTNEPASLIMSLTVLEEPGDIEAANSFLAAFKDWCWTRGLLDKWTWNVPLETLLNWTVVETPEARALRWAPTYLGAEKVVELQPPPWQPELMDRDKYEVMLADWLNKAERTMEEETGLVRRHSKRRSGDSTDDLDRHLRWFVRWQVGREPHERKAKEGIGERRTVQKAVTAVAEELDLTRRSTASEKTWSLAAALECSMHT